jgi:hypothetical protein
MFNAPDKIEGQPLQAFFLLPFWYLAIGRGLQWDFNNFAKQLNSKSR